MCPAGMPRFLHCRTVLQSTDLCDIKPFYKFITMATKLVNNKYTKFKIYQLTLINDY